MDSDVEMEDGRCDRGIPRKGVKRGSTARGYTTIAVAAQLESVYKLSNPANLRRAIKKGPLKGPSGARRQRLTGFGSCGYNRVRYVKALDVFCKQSGELTCLLIVSCCVLP